jgi:nucleotide-binding universal stress UspA family protein
MKILLAIDSSPSSQFAVEALADRPWPAGSRVRIISVVRPYTPPVTEFGFATAPLEDIRRQQMQEAERLVARAAETLSRTGLPLETAVLEGDPRGSIVDEADEWLADLIVLSSHGHKGLERLLLGSVAQAVVAHAHCSVEVVRRRGQAR